jgi:hypothetical protein
MSDDAKKIMWIVLVIIALVILFRPGRGYKKDMLEEAQAKEREAMMP